MARARHRRRFQPRVPDLERRELLTKAVPAEVAPGDTFAHDGIDGNLLHRAFVNRLNDRLSISQSQTRLVFEAFQVFKSGYSTLPADPAARGPALAGLLAGLNGHLGPALSTYRLTTDRVSPSTRTARKFSPEEARVLIPFAQAQVRQLGEALASGPSDPTPALNVAYNAILNALAEYTTHPNLFTSPGDFYLNPAGRFTIDFNGTPASALPGFFFRGPRGAVLSGTPPGHV